MDYAQMRFKFKFKFTFQSYHPQTKSFKCSIHSHK